MTSARHDHPAFALAVRGHAMLNSLAMAPHRSLPVGSRRGASVHAAPAADAEPRGHTARRRHPLGRCVPTTPRRQGRQGVCVCGSVDSKRCGRAPARVRRSPAVTATSVVRMGTAALPGSDPSAMAQTRIAGAASRVRDRSP